MVATRSGLIEGNISKPEILNNVERVLVSDEELNRKYRNGEMRLVTEQGRIDLHTIGYILDANSNGKRKYILNSHYQRRRRWSNKKKSLLIESFIMNIPVPPIFLYEVKYAEYEVMDGLQRLTTIYDFYKDEFELEGLEYWKELNGRRYSQLPENVKKGIDRRYLSSIILLEETAKNKEEAEFFKKIVFERLNSGGVPLNAQEIRNALYSGKFNDLCIELSENEKFRKMWHFPLINGNEEENRKLYKNPSYKEMKDVELVLAFFANRHIIENASNIISINSFFTSYLKWANSLSNEIIQHLKVLFIETMEVIYEILGNRAFVMPSKEQEGIDNIRGLSLKGKTPSKTIYYPMIVAFAKNITHKDKLLENKVQIKEKLYNNSEYYNGVKEDIFSSGNNKKNDIIKRIEYFDSLLKNYIN